MVTKCLGFDSVEIMYVGLKVGCEVFRWVTVSGVMEIIE